MEDQQDQAVAMAHFPLNIKNFTFTTITLTNTLFSPVCLSALSVIIVNSR